MYDDSIPAQDANKESPETSCVLPILTASGASGAFPRHSPPECKKQESPPPVGSEQQKSSILRPAPSLRRRRSCLTSGHDILPPGHARASPGTIGHQRHFGARPRTHDREGEQEILTGSSARRIQRITTGPDHRATAPRRESSSRRMTYDALYLSGLRYTPGESHGGVSVS